jgi:hypothetical protein
MVGGSNGGPVDNTTWNKSFHGDQEIVAEKYQLCARHISPEPIAPTYQWVNFTNCLNGYKGIAICTYYFPDQINDNAKICAEATGFDWNALNSCATGAVGTQLYKASAIYTSDQIAQKVIPPYGERYGDSFIGLFLFFSFSPSPSSPSRPLRLRHRCASSSPAEDTAAAAATPHSPNAEPLSLTAHCSPPPPPPPHHHHRDSCAA